MGSFALARWDNKFIYDVWGDTINLADALRAVCPPGSILVSKAVHHRLQDLYEFEAMGELVANGKTKLNGWRLKNTQLSVPTEGLGIS